MKTGVEWFNEEINKLNVGTDARVFIAKLFEQAREMERQDKISLLEWIRDNTVEVQDGWQYTDKTYTDEEIIDVCQKQKTSKSE